MKRTVTALFLLTSFWWILSLFLGEPFLPSPDNVFFEMIEQLIRGDLLIHLGISMMRVSAAILLAFLPALILGILAGRSKRVDNLVSPVMYVLFPIPKVALLPVILLLFGLGNSSKILLVSLIVFFLFYLNIRDETNGISKSYFDSLNTLGGSAWDQLIHIILPALMPRIFSTIRICLGTAIAVLFLAETFATRQGIGWYIMDAWSRLNYRQMFAGITGISLAAMILFGLLDTLERRICTWK